MIRDDILFFFQCYRLVLLFFSICQHLLQDTLSNFLSSSSFSSFNNEFNTYILHAIKLVKNTQYLIFQEILLKSTFFSNICLNYY